MLWQLCFPVLLNHGVEEGGEKILLKISHKRAIVKITKNNSKSIYILFLWKRPGERYLASQFVEAGRTKWRPKFYLRSAFYILSSLGKLHIRIDRGTSRQEVKIAESCVETSDEDGNYDLSGVVAMNLRSQRRQPVWWQPQRWANLGNGFISSIILLLTIKIICTL